MVPPFNMKPSNMVIGQSKTVIELQQRQGVNQKKIWNYHPKHDRHVWNGRFLQHNSSTNLDWVMLDKAIHQNLKSSQLASGRNWVLNVILATAFNNDSWPCHCHAEEGTCCLSFMLLCRRVGLVQSDIGSVKSC